MEKNSETVLPSSAIYRLFTMMFKLLWAECLELAQVKSGESLTVAICISGVTVCLVFGGVALAYRPDDLGRDWAQREAYLELRRREKLGLPPVDPNYIPLDQIWLPTDEELGDTEVVI